MGEDKLNKYTVGADPTEAIKYYSANSLSTFDLITGTSIAEQSGIPTIDKVTTASFEDSYWTTPSYQKLQDYTVGRYVSTEQISEGSTEGRGIGQIVREEEELIKRVETLRENLAGWYEDYVKNDNKKSIKSRRQSYKPNSKAVKQKISLDEALSAFNDVANKDLGDVILSGSIALAIQGIISRREFKDIDVISFQKFELDDDMSTYDRMDYPVQQELGQLSSFLYDGYLFDVFIFDPTTKVKTVEVEYNGETYLCQHYSEIIMAKLRMVFPKIKDIDEIKKYIDFNIL